MVARAGEREERDWVSFGWMLWYPAYGVLAALIYLSAVEIDNPSRPIRVVAPPVIGDSPDWAETFPGHVESLHTKVSKLIAEPLGAAVTAEDAQGGGDVRWTHRLLEATVERERRPDVEAALNALRATEPGLSIVTEDTFNGSQVLVGLDGLLTHTLRVVWSDQPSRPRVGLVVMGLGDDLRLAREIIELDPPVAVAILPFRPFSAQVAELAKIFERDAFLQWSEASAQDVEALATALATVPGAIGVTLVGGGDVASEVDAALLAAVRERGLHPIAVYAAGEGPFVAALPMGDGQSGDGPAFELITRRAQSGGRAIGLASGVGRAELVQVRSMLSKWGAEEIDVVRVSQLFAASGARPAT